MNHAQFFGGTDEIKRTLATRVLQARKKLDLTESDLAVRVGVKESVVIEFEKCSNPTQVGPNAAPTIHALGLILNVLDLSIFDVMPVYREPAGFDGARNRDVPTAGSGNIPGNIIAQSTVISWRINEALREVCAESQPISVDELSSLLEPSM